jgi:NAD(P)-dependent dehydrogenase (short-subunit alcohol dehydrogenase family)
MALIVFLIMHRDDSLPSSPPVNTHTDGSMAGARQLKELTALITGGGRGIGRAIALAFAAEGADVAVAARTEPEIEEVAARCRDLGSDALAVRLDVTDQSSCTASVDQCLGAWGRINVLVNNAGSAVSSKFVEIDDQLWRHTLDVDLTGPFYMIRAVLPSMLRRADGVVITISSIAGKVGAPYIAPYSAAKHGVIGLMRSLAAEYPRSGVTFNCVCPAYVDTPMTERAVRNIMHRTGRSRDAALGALITPQGRLIRPEEVAAMCVLLAGPSGRSINGQAFNVDGGSVQW